VEGLECRMTGVLRLLLHSHHVVRCPPTQHITICSTVMGTSLDGRRFVCLLLFESEHTVHHRRILRQFAETVGEDLVDDIFHVVRLEPEHVFGSRAV
jgi:hypothetical protein